MGLRERGLYMEEARLKRGQMKTKISSIKVKGFIFEDDQGREFVMACDLPHVESARTFELRGWQRRRLVPLKYTEREFRQIVAEMLFTLNDVLTSLQEVAGDMDVELTRENIIGSTSLKRVDKG